MEKLIEKFPAQLAEAIEIGKNANITNHNYSLNNILICGLGGSGIGGSLVQNLLLNEISVPIQIYKSYTLPHFVNENTLLIISSYSGNTEETVACLQTALHKKCKIVCISSGGKVEEIALENKIDFIKIPGDMPPRACLGYSSVQLFFVLNALKFVDSQFQIALEETINLLNAEKDNIKIKAHSLAQQILNKEPIIYIADHFEAVAIRWRQQFNENSKILCNHHVIPEMNHNELVGWRTKNEQKIVLILRNEDDLERIQSRIELNKTIIKEYTSHIEEIWSKGSNKIEKAYYLIYIGDWVSLYLSQLREVDTTEVKVIDFLKGELAKQSE